MVATHAQAPIERDELATPAGAEHALARARRVVEEADVAAAARAAEPRREAVHREVQHAAAAAQRRPDGGRDGLAVRRPAAREDAAALALGEGARPRGEEPRVA